MNGMSNTQFAPEGSLTRAQMATIAYRSTQQQASATTVNGPAVSSQTYPQTCRQQMRLHTCNRLA